MAVLLNDPDGFNDRIRALWVSVQQGPVGGGGMRAIWPALGPAEAIPTLSNVTLIGVDGTERRPLRVSKWLQSGRPAIRLEDGGAQAARNALMVGFAGPALRARSGVVAHFDADRSSFTQPIPNANLPFLDGGGSCVLGY